MSLPAPPIVYDWSDNLTAGLQGFVSQWRSFAGTEMEGAQDFLRNLLEIYEVKAVPGTIFEQHPVRLPARRGSATQGRLFGAEDTPQYTTERMDMYLPRICVWEMKAPSEKDLQKHHQQILNYWAHVRTRYMVLSNFHELWIYDTNDEDGQLAPKLIIKLEELPARGNVLFFLRGEEPDLSERSERVTAEVAATLGHMMREFVAASREPEQDRERITRLVLQCVFSMFAEDTDLIPPKMFTGTMEKVEQAGRLDPLWALFDDFSRREGEAKTNRFAPYINGPLFNRNQARITLSDAQIHDLHIAARDFDWKDVRPEIFGSIFEQALDAVERHELGAHYTREIDIGRVVNPSILAPWRERIIAIRTPKDAERVVEEMRAFHVLDPACGCGNFLYVVYREMKRLESALVDKWNYVQRKAAKRRADMRPAPPRPYFTLAQIHGIEIDTTASFLARVVLWIGEHLAQRELGLEEETLPLKNLETNVRNGDALALAWPRPTGELAIVGNPPYLGVRKLRAELGDEYVENLFSRFPNNRAADYVTYWFTRALEVLKPGERAGFVATNSIAQNESREASIDRILAKKGTITDAWKSYVWPGDAAVHVAVVNWIMAPFDGILMLDGKEALSISPGLTESADSSAARTLPKNEGLCFMGVTPGNNEFVLTEEQRAAIIAADPHSESVIRPFLIGRDVNREVDQGSTRWIIDFGIMSKEEAEAFHGAVSYVRRHVYPIRKENRREAYAKNWWRFVEARPGLRAALVGQKQVLVLPRVSPHLAVSRQEASTCFDGQLMVVALSDDYHFGILQSRIHSIWAWARGSTLKGDLRYTNTTIFETFPFPKLPQRKKSDPLYDPRVRPTTPAAERVARTSRAFDELRSATCRERQLGLTKIHNLLKAGELPALQAAYDAMNDAVAECYGFPAGIWRDEKETLRRLLELNKWLAGVLEG